MDSGVVIRMSAGWRAKRARSAAGVSPVRMAMVGSWNSTPAARRGLGDADQRRAQVALDVDGEGFDGRNVEDAAALVARRDGREHQAVDAPQKGGERLAGAGGREDQGGFAARDGGPAELLRPRGGGEDGVEPRTHRRMEEGEGGFSGHDSSLITASGGADPLVRAGGLGGFRRGHYDPRLAGRRAGGGRLGHTGGSR